VFMLNNEEHNEETLFETNYIKGIRLENMFCEYMKTELKWDKARTRAQMKSNTNNRGSNVDIIAETTDGRGRMLLLLSAFYIIVATLVYYYGFFSGYKLLYWFSGAIYLVSFASIFLSFKYKNSNAWVECKNQRANVTFAQMQKTINEFKAYKQSKSREYKFVAQYFVSASGFAETALKLAKDETVHCYILKNGNFEKISYWES